MNRYIYIYILALIVSIPPILDASLPPCNSCLFTLTDSMPGILPTEAGLSFSSQGCIAGTIGQGQGDPLLRLVEVDDNCIFTGNTFTTTFSEFPPIRTSFSPTGDCIAISDSGSVRLFAVENCQLGNLTFASEPGSSIFSLQGCLASFGTGAGTTVFFDQFVNCNDVSSALINVPDTPLEIAFSTDGSCLAVGTANNVYLYSMTGCSASQNPTDSINVGVSGLFSLAFSPNNCLAVLTASQVQIYQVAPDCTFVADTPQFVTNSVVAPRQVTFSTHNCLAVANQNAVTIYNLSNCTIEPDTPPVTTISVAPAETSGIAFSPNGECLAVASSNGNLSLYARNTFVPAPIITNAIVNCNGTVTIAGTTEPNFNIQIFADGNPDSIGSTTATDTGNFDITVGPLLPGMHTITAVATNPLTECSSESSNVEMIISDITLPVITSVTTTCSIVIVSGTAPENIPVTLLVDEVPVGSVISDSNGNFIFINVPTLGGFHQFIAQIVQDGCIVNSLPFDTIINFPNCNPLSSPNLAFGSHCNV